MPLFVSRLLWQGGALLCFAAALALPLAAVAGGLPKTEDQLIAAVKAAIAERDMAAFDQLINWSGASPMKRRIVSYEVRRGLGRKVRSIAIEPFPKDGLRALEADGSLKLKSNMAVTHRLRVVYDEPPMEGVGIPPTSVFLIGHEGEEFRIALIVRASPPKD